MMRGGKNALIFLINCPQDYLSHEDVECAPAEAAHFFMTISEVFLPLLGMFSRLERDNIPYRISLVIPSSTLTMLEDPYMQEQFVAYMERRIEFGSKCLLQCSDCEKEAITHQMQKAKDALGLFVHDYAKRLLPIFDEYRKRGTVELLATCGTDIFLPHYIDLKETCSAQVETGLYAFKTFFGESADGFFLPEMGYAPGLEQILHSYWVKYTVLDARAVLFSCDKSSGGIFTPVRCISDVIGEQSNALCAFARDNSLRDKFFGSGGYASHGEYCDTARDKADDMRQADLDPFISRSSQRYPSFYRTYSRSGKAYHSAIAHDRAVHDASLFLKRTLDTFEKASPYIPASPLSLTCVFNALDFTDKWSEALDMIECAFRGMTHLDITAATFKEVLYALRKTPLEAIHPYMSAASGAGYGECLLSGRNSWMLAPVRRASRRMTELSERFFDGSTLKSRMLNLGAKELMLSQSAQWPKRIDALRQDTYAERQFKDCLSAFTTVFEDLGSNTVTPSWLTSLEAKHLIFPWLNYKIFCKKR